MSRGRGNRIPVEAAHSRNYRIYLAVLSLSFVWCFLIASVPFLAHGKGIAPILANVIRLFFSPICHQASERSFILSGQPLAVCSRCTGIYAGFFLGLILFPFLRRDRHSEFPPRRVLLASATPMLLELILAHTQLYESGTVIRSITGLIPGGTMVFYVMPSLFDLATPNPQREVHSWTTHPANSYPP